MRVTKELFKGKGQDCEPPTGKGAALSVKVMQPLGALAPPEMEPVTSARK